MPQTRIYRRLIVTGIVIVAALAIFGIVARQTFLRHEFTLTMYVDDSAGVAASSPVLENGIPIGHVFLVLLSGSKDPKRTVEIEMRFSRRYLADIPEDSTAGITAANLLGDKYVNISRGTHARHVDPGAELRATETQDIGSVLSRAQDPLKQANDIFDRVDTILKYVGQSHGSVGRLVNDSTLQGRIEGIASGVKSIEADLKTGKGAALRVADITADADKPMARLKEMMADLDHGKGSAGKFLHDSNSPTLTAEADAVIAEARKLFDEASHDQRPAETMSELRAMSDKIAALTDRIDSGRGTAGQLLVNPLLRDSLRRTEADLDRLATAIGAHPTRYFAIRFGLF
jgi:phospholipid/cholesterol/gamma-HCH transport system substrate-binding protein